MTYKKELDFITKKVQKAFNLFSTNIINVEQKSKHDLVTNIDKNIENYISQAINLTFPDDKILGEETSNNTLITGRTWTIDPIDGTCNMAAGIELYGIQCSLIENSQIVLAIIYIPSFNYLISAVKNEGCFLNKSRIYAKKDVNINNAIISFGDYPHANSHRLSHWQHKAINNISNTVAKIRMFGAACIDFSFVAAGKTDGTVVLTKNLWDVAPGILICKEAGAIVVDLDGNEFNKNSEGVIVGSNENVTKLLVDSFAHKKNINSLNIQKKYDGVIFDFDGVILDTEKYHFAAWNTVFNRYQAQISLLEYEKLKGTSKKQIIEYFDKKFNLKLSLDEKNDIAQLKNMHYLNLIRVLNKNDFIPSVIEYLNFLKKNFIKIGIASSSQVVKLLLNEFGLTDYFDVIIDGQEPIKKKPSPDIFLETSTRMSILPANCLVFEDSQSGIEAAIAGGFDVICIGSNQNDHNISCIKDFSSLI